MSQPTKQTGAVTFSGTLV